MLNTTQFFPENCHFENYTLRQNLLCILIQDPYYTLYKRQATIFGDVIVSYVIECTARCRKYQLNIEIHRQLCVQTEAQFYVYIYYFVHKNEKNVKHKIAISCVFIGNFHGQSITTNNVDYFEGIANIVSVCHYQCNCFFYSSCQDINWIYFLIILSFSKFRQFSCVKHSQIIESIYPIILSYFMVYENINDKKENKWLFCVSIAQNVIFTFHVYTFVYHDSCQTILVFSLVPHTQHVLRPQYQRFHFL